MEKSIITPINQKFEYRQTLEEFRSECQLNNDVIDFLLKANPKRDLIHFWERVTYPDSLNSEEILNILNFSYYLYYATIDKKMMKQILSHGASDTALFRAEFYKSDYSFVLEQYVNLVYVLLFAGDENSFFINNLQHVLDSDFWYKEAISLFNKYKFKEFAISARQLPTTIELSNLRKKVIEMEQTIDDLQKENEDLRQRPEIATEEETIYARVQIKVFIFLLKRAGIDLTDPKIEERRIKSTVCQLLHWLGVKYKPNAIKNYLIGDSLDPNTHSEEIQKVNEWLRKINPDWKIDL